MQADDLGLDGFTTQLKRLGNKEMQELTGSDYELERALAEIQTVLGRRNSNT